MGETDIEPREANMTRILVVDDDPMVCMAIEVYLERHGFDVTIADGGATGLRALEGNAFDLMIVDIFMPHMCVALPAQAVHAGRAADHDQRMSCGSPFARRRRHRSVAITPVVSGIDRRT